MTALLQVRSLCVDAGPIRLVEDVDLDIAAGERVALVGESGSGKSVTARALLRLDTDLRISGSIMLDGTELTALDEKQMRVVRGRRIGMVFQDPMSALNPLMTIGAQVDEVFRGIGVPRREANGRTRDLLGELGVPNPGDRMRAYPHEFSGGMRQRVVMAMALAAEPELLVADEPTTALDVRVQEQVLALLGRVAGDRGLGILLITHDLGIVANFAERAVVMYGGRIAHTDPVPALFADPLHPYTRGLLDALPRLNARVPRLRAIPGSPPQPADRPSGCAFHPRCDRRMERCSVEEPPRQATPSGGSVACHAVAAGDAAVGTGVGAVGAGVTEVPA